MRWLLEKACNDKRYGARPLRRAIQRYVEDPIADLLIRNGLNTGAGDIHVDMKEEKLVFESL
jgi:ATP-dependent Clp protease ATP-binding subunit ClpC